MTGAVTIVGTENMVIDQCQFANIRMTDYADALFDVADSSGIVVQNTIFTNNSATNLDPSELILFQNNTFSGNSFDENE